MSAVATRAEARPGGGLLADRPIWLTWGLLVVATVVTTWVLTSDSIDARWGLVFMMVVAAWKVRLVLTDFIGLKHAPLVGRLVFEGWALLLPAVLVVLAWPR